MSSSLSLPESLPDNPAKEWATTTTSALDHTLTQSGQSTPGLYVPGAFPKTSDESVVESSPCYGVGSAVIDKARQYLPQSVLNTVETYIGSTGHSKITPNEMPLKQSLPSQEIVGANAGESIGGVRSLPGTHGEPGVSKLPDERDNDEKSHPVPGYMAVAKESLGKLPQSTARVYGNTDGSNGHIERRADQPLPSENVNGLSVEKDPSNESASGTPLCHGQEVRCDDLDSSQDPMISRVKDADNQVKLVDFDIKKPVQANDLEDGQDPQNCFPDTSKQRPDDLVAFSGTGDEFKDDRLSNQMSTPGWEAENSPHSALESKKVESVTVNDAPDPNTNKALPQKPDSTLATSSAGREKNPKELSHGEDYHPAELHGDHSQHETKIADDKKSTPSEPRSKSQRSSISSDGSPKKVGIKGKISGGAKVFMGTIGRNHDKVEAGKKILQGGL